MKKPAFLFFLVFLCAAALSAQIPVNVEVQILKAEDARAYGPELEALLKSPNEDIRIRAALAAGRIGNVTAVPALVRMRQNERSAKAQDMAAFALGEIESADAADAILRAIGETAKPNLPGVVPSERGRLAEAAGKIAAAIPQAETRAVASVPDIKKRLGEAIVFTLEAEHHKASGYDKETVLLALTAALRARPEKAEVTVQKFLAFTDPDIVATALNTLARLRAKNANKDARDLLATHTHAVVRAHAARVLGTAEDKEAVDVLIKAATGDSDSRVRVSAIRALATLKDAKAAEPLLQRGEVLFAAYKKAKKPNFIPNEHSEFLEIATALGRLLPNTRNERAVDLFSEFGKLDRGHSAEVYIARLRVAPGRGDTNSPELSHWRQYSTLAQVVGEFSDLEPTNDEGKKMKSEAADVLRPLAKAFAEADPVAEKNTIMAGPDVLQAFARFKTDDLAEILRMALKNEDLQIRATAANLLGELPTSPENSGALKRAALRGMFDKDNNDATLAALDALYKTDKKTATGVLLIALTEPDYLVRRNVLAKLSDKELLNYGPEIPSWLATARDKRWGQVLLYDPKTGTKLGQILNADADYKRAAARKNGTVKAVLTTEKGTFTIDLLPEDAPLTVDNFIKLAKSNYFNGLEVHRVVPNFVMQDGDPRGDGNGGPGWSIRCEINMVPYERGAVGMALSGKDTGGSQWFVAHSPQPHLDGGYTVFGRVNETGMKVVDNIVRGDKIVSVRIVEGRPPQRTQRTRRS